MGKNSKRKEPLEAQLIFNVIDKKRRELLPFLKEFKNEFYLAGGTALAIQLGHIKSIDFDFFSNEKFDLLKLQKKNSKLFKGFKITITQLEPDTLSMLINEDVKISFFNIE